MYLLEQIITYLICLNLLKLHPAFYLLVSYVVCKKYNLSSSKNNSNLVQLNAILITLKLCIFVIEMLSHVVTTTQTLIIMTRYKFTNFTLKYRLKS